MTRTASFALLVLAASALAVAQTKPDVPVPELLNEVQFFDPSAHALVKLEKVLSKMETKTKLAGFAGAKSGFFLENGASPVRLPGAEGLTFVVRAGGTGLMGLVDPSQLIRFYRLDPNGGRRELLLQSGGGVFGGRNRSSDEIALDYSLMQEGVYAIVSPKRLPKGEYAFVVMGMGQGAMGGSATLFAFGVD